MFSIPQELALKVMNIELPAAVMVHLLDEMSNTEERLAHGGSERLQLGSLVGAFATARYVYSSRSNESSTPCIAYVVCVRATLTYFTSRSDSSVV